MNFAVRLPTKAAFVMMAGYSILCQVPKIRKSQLES